MKLFFPHYDGERIGPDSAGDSLGPCNKEKYEISMPIFTGKSPHLDFDNSNGRSRWEYKWVRMECKPVSYLYSFNFKPIEIVMPKCMVRLMEGALMAKPDYHLSLPQEILRYHCSKIVDEFYPGDDLVLECQQNSNKKATREALWECVGANGSWYYFKRTDWKYLPNFFEFQENVSIEGIPWEERKPLDNIKHVNKENLRALNLVDRYGDVKVSSVDNLIKYLKK